MTQIKLIFTDSFYPFLSARIRVVCVPFFRLDAAAVFFIGGCLMRKRRRNALLGTVTLLVLALLPLAGSAQEGETSSQGQAEG